MPDQPSVCLPSPQPGDFLYHSRVQQQIERILQGVVIILRIRSRRTHRRQYWLSPPTFGVIARMGTSACSSTLDEQFDPCSQPMTKSIDRSSTTAYRLGVNSVVDCAVLLQSCRRNKSALRSMLSEIRTIVAPSRQDTAFAVSPLNITASVPSRIALATSEVSARVATGWVIIDSGICVATITGNRHDYIRE